MVSKEDEIQTDYTYAWHSGSNLPLKDFLAKYKPSKVQNDGTKPWIWVTRELPIENETTAVEAAVQEAIEYLKEVTEKVDTIKNDDSIPVRANKKKGIQSKKELREEVQKKATDQLKYIAQRHGFVVGKWLIFAPSDKVDSIWTSLSNSLINGPLSQTSAYRAKVSTSPQNDTPNHQHVLCLYMPDVYDRGSVSKVMKVLLRNHGMNLMGVKSDLYTAIGLDSKHASGVPSTVWKTTALMKDTDIKELKQEYFAELTAAKTAANEAGSAGDATVKPKPGTVSKKKETNTNPFVSDDEDEQPESKVKHVAKPKQKVEDPFASGDDAEDEEEKQRKEELQAKKTAAEMKSKNNSSRKRAKSESEEEEIRPRKRSGRK